MEHSDDNSDYETAPEDEPDIATVENVCVNSTRYHQEVFKHDMDESLLEQETETLDDDANILLDWASEGASLDPGRRRKLSKKQKRKKRNKICDTFDIETLTVEDITSDTIDDAFSYSNKTRNCTGIQRPVPNLFELCAKALKRTSKSGIRGNRTASASVGPIPLRFKQLISDWGEGQRTCDEQISFLRNHVLPLSRLYRNSILGANPRKTKPPRRSVFSPDSLFMPEEKQLSFLYSPPCGQRLGEEPSHHALMVLETTAADAALAATIELMLPDNVKAPHPTRKLMLEADAVCKATEANLNHVKQLLTKSGDTVAVVTERIFKSVIPYVMWARANVTMATKFFQDLVKKAPSAHTRAMYLSEIARMHAMFGDGTMAVYFYKLASTSVMNQHKYTEDILTDLGDQSQVLLASVADTGVLTEEKAVESYNCWRTVMATPRQSRVANVMAGIDAFLCFHASHWKETDWLSEGHARIAGCVFKHSYLHFYLSMLYALQGDETQSKNEYVDLYHSCMDFEEVNYPAGRQTNAWQPLVDIVSNQRSPVLPLNVVWRVQLQPSCLSHKNLLETQVHSKELNLRISESGHVTGDMQMLLPPMRDISMDPYTGSLVINSTPNKTRAWKTAYFHPQEFHTSGLMIPTPIEIYSDTNGTTVHMVFPCHDTIARLTPENVRTVCPFTLYWRDTQCHSAKLNIYTVLKSYLKEAVEKVLYQGLVDVDDKEAYDHVLELAVSKNLSLSIADLRRSASLYCKKKIQQQQQDAESPSKPGNKHKPKRKQVYMHETTLYFKLYEEPIVYGKTIVLYIEVPSHREKLLVFIRTGDRDSFLHAKIYQHNSGCLLGGRGNKTDAKFFMHMTQYDSLYVYNEEGDRVLDVDMKDLDPNDKPFGFLNPVVIGDHVHAVDRTLRSIWKLNILEPVDSIIFENLTTRALDSCWGEITGSVEKQIWDLTVIGREDSGVRKLILVNMSGGLAFMDPVSTELIDICVADMGSSTTKLSTNHKVWLGHSVASQVLCEKSFMRVGNQQAVILVAIGCYSDVLLFEISQNAGHDDVIITLTNTLAIPGVVKEACFIGKAEILVCTTLHEDDCQYYREHLLHFRLDGLLHAMLPCLGPGPRSFLPAYLYGNEGQGQQAGWYVYMRDGHHGIIAVRLHD